MNHSLCATGFSKGATGGAGCVKPSAALFAEADGRRDSRRDSAVLHPESFQVNGTETVRRVRGW
jgi:hypothetical protein